MQKKDILICDDNQEIIDLITLILESKGHEVRSINNCESIWEIIDERTPDIIIMDLWIPKMGGEEATKILKSKESTRDIKIYLLSASDKLQEIVDRTGADGFIPKPFELAKLDELMM